MTNANIISTQIKFRLRLSDISELEKVDSPEVIVHNIPWKVFVQKLDYKGKYSLFPFLYCSKNDKSSNRSLCATFKLLSFTEKKDVIAFGELDDPVKFDSKDVSQPDVEDEPLTKFISLIIDPILPWDELFESQNGFVKNDAIVLEVEIKANNSECSITDKQKERKLLQLECVICLENFCNQEISSTQCGHLYCTKCIENSIAERQNCPLCNKKITLESLQRIYLPM